MKKFFSIVLTLTVAACCVTPDAQARRIPKEVEDTALYNKVADVLDAVDALYGQANVDLYRTYRDSGVGFFLGKQALRFADPVIAQNVLNEMPESWRNREDIKVLEQRIAARVATRPGMTYANVKGQNAQGQPTDLAAANTLSSISGPAGVPGASRRFPT